MTLYYVKFAVVRGSTWVSKGFTLETPFDIYMSCEFFKYKNDSFQSSNFLLLLFFTDFGHM